MAVVRVTIVCPVCNLAREVSQVRARVIGQDPSKAVCANGRGCRSALTPEERLRRWWLEGPGGVEPNLIVVAGGAAGYVLAYGLPEALQLMDGL